MSAHSPSLAREMADARHEIAIHGRHHRPLPMRGPRAAYDDPARTRDAVADVTGRLPVLFRPPYGVMTTAAHLACRRLGLTPVLWTCWGEDWRRRATPASVRDTVLRDLLGGGTILLHDSDRTSATGSWRTTVRRCLTSWTPAMSGAGTSVPCMTMGSRGSLYELGRRRS